MIDERQKVIIYNGLVKYGKALDTIRFVGSTLWVESWLVCWHRDS